MVVSGWRRLCLPVFWLHGFCFLCVILLLVRLHGQRGSDSCKKRKDMVLLVLMVVDASVCVGRAASQGRQIQQLAKALWFCCGALKHILLHVTVVHYIIDNDILARILA
jgi:hypothetical protein